MRTNLDNKKACKGCFSAGCYTHQNMLHIFLFSSFSGLYGILYIHKQPKLMCPPLDADKGTAIHFCFSLCQETPLTPDLLLEVSFSEVTCAIGSFEQKVLFSLLGSFSQHASAG